MIDATYPVPMSLCPHLYNQELFLCVVQFHTNTEACSAEQVFTSTCPTCGADIGNLGEHTSGSLKNPLKKNDSAKLN